MAILPSLEQKCFLFFYPKGHLTLLRYQFSQCRPKNKVTKRSKIRATLISYDINTWPFLSDSYRNWTWENTLTNLSVLMCSTISSKSSSGKLVDPFDTWYRWLKIISQMNECQKLSVFGANINQWISHHNNKKGTWYSFSLRHTVLLVSLCCFCRKSSQQ